MGKLKFSINSGSRINAVKHLLEDFWKACNAPRMWRVKLIRFVWPEIVPVIESLRDYYWDTKTKEG